MSETREEITRKSRWPLIKTILIILFLLLVGIQFLQPSKDNQNADMRNAMDKAVELPDEVNRILRKSCYDCHSNYTNYPWYSNIQPGGWLMDRDIRNGKARLNFQTFATVQPEGNYKTREAYQRHLLEEIAKVTSEGEMPLKAYMLLHEEARISDAERKIVADWARKAASEIIEP